MDDVDTIPENRLYDEDFYAWTQRQAALMGARRLDEIDWSNIVEEIETLGRSERNALRSSYRLVAMHLLKMKWQPPGARREAASETKLALKTFPAVSPFTLDEIEDHEFWPVADGT